MDDWSSGNILLNDPMRIYRAKRDAARKRVTDKYAILGFISSGTYGKVYKAQSKEPDGRIHAIKKFKPDKEGDVVAFTGISQSAIREIALNREISHENVVALKEVILEDKSIYMVFEYAEHDFLQVIHHHSQTLRSSISLPVLKSLTYQLLNGLLYLHDAHIIHRDLKPANILITSSGVVKIGDLGLARLTHQPLQPLCLGDKVVVTIWYRAPELLLGAKHYNKAVDIWAVGCVMAELASLRPIFKGEEAKLDSKKNVPFQKDQLLKIFEVLGTPSERDWPKIRDLPEYESMRKLDQYWLGPSTSLCSYTNRLSEWCQSRIRSHGADLLAHLFAYDPDRRLTAAEALQHKWFQEEPRPTRNAFASLPSHQIPPHRRITHDDAPSMMHMAAVGSQVQAQVSQVQATAQAHLSQQLSHSHSNHSKVGSAASFASLSGGAGGAGSHTRKKARLG
ncbi:kinase-like protein [Trametes punicea]|nr:kinase-like protein [Trametes punicea]